jgi:hypothetical protein
MEECRSVGIVASSGLSLPLEYRKTLSVIDARDGSSPLRLIGYLEQLTVGMRCITLHLFDFSECLDLMLDLALLRGKG